MSVVCDYIDFADTSKSLYLYDCFQHRPGDAHCKLAEQYEDLRAIVASRFAKYERAKIIQGYVPESFALGAPERVCFAHIDMNHAAAEVAALEFLWLRLQPGAFVILDDYGFTGFEEQQAGHDAFLASKGLKVMALPTGQGLVTIPPNKT